MWGHLPWESSLLNREGSRSSRHFGALGLRFYLLRVLRVIRALSGQNCSLVFCIRLLRHDLGVLLPRLPFSGVTSTVSQSNAWSEVVSESAGYVQPDLRHSTRALIVCSSQWQRGHSRFSVSTCVLSSGAMFAATADMWRAPPEPRDEVSVPDRNKRHRGQWLFPLILCVTIHRIQG